ncbi:ExbD/TolR family protein [Brevifollis gellanilyticus]|uniref:Biopolymer transporter ExbD n=1 Tax=Brevifollis gellanilyticus TaxID=748831 RepID=A0A512M870_9BACT|nr:biopolymer transporter ExbD [Brevifollis gellanilyticus]GEP42927.1 hypothetical protein BGE01nite_22180 [Brevifollis gellanilyticus]
MKKTRLHTASRKAAQTDDAPPSFQIAPMIDVIFVIMLFFMVMAGSVKVERELRMKLPGGPAADATSRMPDAEILLGVHEDGTVTLNEEPMDHPWDKNLPALTATLNRLAQASMRDRSHILATVEAEPAASYSRIIDVLASLQRASIPDVTFTVGGE